MNYRIAMLINLIIIMHGSLAAKEYKYPVSEIPDSLKQNAKVVIRNLDKVFEYKSPKNGTLSVSYVLTILNENGLSDAMFQCAYSQKLNRVYNIRGSVYNAAGEKIENLVLGEILDVSDIAGYSLYEDHRMKVYRPHTMSFPFTVEYSYTMDFDGLISIPEWDPISDYNISLMTSTFKLICNKGLKIKYIERSIRNETSIVESEMATTYSWKLENIPAFVEQPFSEPFSGFCPNVNPIPADIEIEGYKGSLASWTSIGNWVDQLNNGKSELSPETIALLKEKVKSCSTDYEKAAVVYAYMQSKTRYLNITIGIGGWQPIAASTIDRLGYGDCKALSNYTKSLLEAVGIKSYYTLIRAGEDIDQIDMNFPQIKFNHVILCVPFVNDTVWLECTSQNLPFGFIGDFTDDRGALLITENGGQIVHTRAYNAEENAVVRNIVMNLDEAGYATISETELNKGIQYSEKLPLFLAGMEDRKKLILDRLNIPGVLLNNFQFEEVRSQLPVLKEKLELEIPRYATISGTRMLVSLIPIEKFKEMPKKVNNRMTDVIIRRSKLTVDTIKIALPEGFQAESIPSEIKTDSRFGSYMLKTAVVNNQIICIRRFEMKKGQYSAQTYSELIDFLRKVATADNSKVSLKKA